MKIILILLAVVVSSLAEEENTIGSRSISSILVKAVENFRNRMPSGFPELGLPPLAPLKISHQGFDIDTPILRLNGSVDNVIVNGLNGFEISEVKLKFFSSRINFHFILKNFNVDTLYDFNMGLKKDNLTINMEGKSPAKLDIKDTNISGFLKYSFNIFTGKLKVKGFIVRVHINKVESQNEGILGEGEVNQKMNDMLAEAIQNGVNDNEKMLTDIIQARIMPIANKALKNVSLYDLIGKKTGILVEA